MFYMIYIKIFITFYFSQFRDIVARYSDVLPDSLSSTASIALTKASQNVAWSNKYADVISNWMTDNEFVLSTTTTIPPDPDSASSKCISVLLITIMMSVSAFI